MMPIHLERIVIVNEERFRPDEWAMPGFDLRHLEAPLKYIGMVDNIDNFYFSEHEEPDDALYNYCLEKKPQLILISLQFGVQKNSRIPTPDILRQITSQLGIATVIFWFDIQQDKIADAADRYLHSVTLTMILGADVISHKTLSLAGSNYIYAGITFDENPFNKPEMKRDIQVGFFGTIDSARSKWIARINKYGIPVNTAGGVFVNGKLPDGSDIQATSAWLSYEKYLKLVSRSKIMLNFSLVGNIPYDPATLVERGRAIATVEHLVQTFKRRILLIIKNPAMLKDTGLALIGSAQYTAQAIVTKPRNMVRARVWESLWCKTFLLEEDNQVTPLYFEPYADYVPFTTLKDLADKIRYYLEHDDERDRVRLHGRATVEKYYNAKIYWQNLFEAIGLLPDGEKHYHPGEIWNIKYFESWQLDHPIY
jgi:hypothetical protein